MHGVNDGSEINRQTIKQKVWILFHNTKFSIREKKKKDAIGSINL
jgi:hypothetical protein